MKTLLLITLAFTTFISLPAITSNDESFLDVKTAIENSLVKIIAMNGTLGSKGSGTLITIKDQLFTLTNAHVCLSTELDNAIFGNKVRNLFNYTIYNSFNKIDLLVDKNDLKYNLSEDWCLIPTAVKLKYKVIDTSFLSDTITPIVKYLTYNRNDKNENTETYHLFRGCTVDVNVGTPSCADHSDRQSNLTQTYLASDGSTEKDMKISEGYAYYLPVISGDSGSPVFDDQNHLIGLITANGEFEFSDWEGKMGYGIMSPINSFKQMVK